MVLPSLDRLSYIHCLLREFLPNYPEVDWKGAMGIRDIIAHHYFDIDETIVFDVVKNKLPGMLETINKMIEEL